MDISLIDNWIAQKPLDASLKQKSVFDYVEERDDQIYEDQVVRPLLSLIPCCNINSSTYSVCVDVCATNIINRIFQDYNKQNCIVLLSETEHENVLKACESNNVNYKRISPQTSNNDIKSIIEKYDTVVVYWIGTQLSTGIINTNSIFDRIKSLSKGKRTVFVLDDVQGMYIVPRDYSKFDYIIGTGHSVVCSFDMGILIHKKTVKPYGFHWINTAKMYVNLLQKIVSDYGTMLCNFYSMMINAFSVELNDPNNIVFQNSAPNIFSIVLHDLHLNSKHFDVFNKHLIHVEQPNNLTDQWYIRLRAQEFIFDYPIIRSGLLKIQQMQQLKQF